MLQERNDNRAALSAEFSLARGSFSAPVSLAGLFHKSRLLCFVPSARARRLPGAVPFPAGKA